MSARVRKMTLADMPENHFVQSKQERSYYLMPELGQVHFADMPENHSVQSKQERSYYLMPELGQVQKELQFTQKVQKVLKLLIQ